MIRGVPMGVDCNSPPRHPAFSTPLELMTFITDLRRLSGGKPVGFKLCIGHRWEFLAIIKANPGKYNFASPVSPQQPFEPLLALVFHS